MIKNIMKNIGLKPVEVEEKEEVKGDVSPGEAGLKKLAEQNEKFLNRRDELIAKGKLTEKEEKTGGMSKHWVQNGEEAMFVEYTPEEEMKIWQEVAARQSNDKLKKAIKNRESKELNPKQKIILEAAKAELAKREENYQN